MSSSSIIAISPLTSYDLESEMINQLFDAGLFRYHINKSLATEQSIAEILENVSPQYLSRITLHSHYHLVLAYGVGGIHYSSHQRHTLGEDYVEKIKLYQGFGVKVSTSIDQLDEQWRPSNYTLLQADDLGIAEGIYPVVKNLTSNSSKKYFAIFIDDQNSFETLIQFLNK